MALVDAHEEAGLGLRRRHEDQPLPAHAQTMKQISLSGSRGARSAVAAAPAAAGGGENGLLPYLD
jgi:hypothetical protein